MVEMRGLPVSGGVACRTGNRLSLPIDHEMSDVEALPSAGLPTGIGWGGAEQRDTILALTVDQAGRVNVASEPRTALAR